MKKTAAVVAGLVLALGAAAPAFADSDATGSAVSSPGVLSGNVFQFPISIPASACGNALGLISALTPTGSTVCDNG